MTRNEANEIALKEINVLINTIHPNEQYLEKLGMGTEEIMEQWNHDIKP